MSFEKAPIESPVLQGDSKQFNFPWKQWFTSLTHSLNTGFTGSVVTAKLTTGGTNGQINFTNGVVTSQTPAT